MAVVRTDRSTCQGYGNCSLSAPGTFDVDDGGTVVVLQAEIGDADRAGVEEAVQGCPVSALWIEDE